MSKTSKTPTLIGIFGVCLFMLKTIIKSNPAAMSRRASIRNEVGAKEPRK